MEKLIFNDKEFIYYEYSCEKDFEKDVVENSDRIFGSRSIYVDIKKRIGNSILSIPDGYLLDFSFANSPRLYIIENELVIHDAYKHIGQQILRFAISYKASGRKIKGFLLNEIENDNVKTQLVDDFIQKNKYRNIDNLLEEMIFENEIGCIVIIDENTVELQNVLSQLSIKTDIVEFKSYISNKKKIHKFEPFQDDIKSNNKTKELTFEELDTIVVPAREDGFNEVFIDQNCWYSVRMSSSMINRVKYIAAYQTAPISAITYYAEISSIEKYKNTNKYIVYFKDKALAINPLKLPKDKPRLSLQSPRYTNFNKLKQAKIFEDVF